MEDQNKNEQPTSRFNPVGLCIGAGIGLCFGVAMNNIGVGLCLGMSIGICFCIALGQKGDKSK